MSFDIINASKNITNKYVRYLRTMFDIENPEYRELFHKRMEEIGSFSKGPYLDVVDSFESGETVANLIKEGTLNKDFAFVEKIYNKTLYKHQELAIRKLSKGKNIVVSTGTGSGKTESFLVPILNSLMEEKNNCGLRPGVRALLVYPMNALANDQISRLRELLKEYPYITFGSYTGQTEEDYDKALAKYKHLNKGEEPLKNELISRSQMKMTPPHLLITNYSMLEYLMLRPKDNSLFQGTYADSWRFVVLDEAHTYSGSTGIEVSMLLRRLKAYLQTSKLNFILTSATLGGEDSNEEVAAFASRLCDAPFLAEDVIRAHRMNFSQNIEDAIVLSENDYIELNRILESGHSDERLYDMLRSYLKIDISAPDYNEYLFHVLLRDKTFWQVKQYLRIPKSVRELGEYFNWNDEQISSFVNVASNAIKDRKKLFDARYHMFIRATDGVFVTLGEHKDLSLTRQTTKYVNDTEYKYFEIATCNQCHAMYLIGNIENGFLKQKANISGENIREAFLIGDVVNVEEDDDSLLEGEHLHVTHYELCPHCGFIREKNQVHKTKCQHSESDYINLTKVKQSERSGRVTKCIKCEGTNNLGVLRSFFSGQEASTSVVGTALFEELPSEIVEKVTLQDDDSGFDMDDGFEIYEKENHISKAKQFIAFSDSRQAAAFFATYFYGTYQSFLYSRIIYENLKSVSSKGKSITRFVEDMSDDFQKNRVSEMLDTDPDYLKESWKAMMKELISSYSRTSLIGLGLMKIGFNSDVSIPSNSKFKLDSNEVADLCLVLLRSMFEDNAIKRPYKFVDADVAFYSNNGSEKIYQISTPDKFIRSFVPKNDTTSNKRFEYLQRVFKAKGFDVDRVTTLNFMKSIWEKILEKQNVIVDNFDHTGKQVDIARLSVINTDKWYRCPKCHRLTANNVANVCPAYKCDGVLESVDVSELEKDNHYYRIFNDLDIRPLRVVEHTAQLNSEEAYKLQDSFKNQDINVLSCSTTFEMGVDIGDLETVFMRNMPPTPSNYVQRAGRAGRSSKSAALALTFCNKSNHDFSYFNNPISMINGEIQPPLFKVENEKIGIRHLYSAAFAFFWKLHPYYFGRIKDFFGAEELSNGYNDFKNYLLGEPADLKAYLLKAFPNELIHKYGINDYTWTKWLFDEPNTTYPNLKYVYEQYRNEVDLLYADKAKLESESKLNSSVIYRINTYTQENIISFLSRNNILPKYGFPVDTVELQIASDRGHKALPIELSRDLAMAISEYAPGCEVVAAGNLIRSRYIKKMPTKTWREYDYVQCSKCKTLNITIHQDSKDSQSLESCKNCSQQFRNNEIRTFLVPEFGFLSEPKIEKPSLIKPDRTYRTEASLVAEGTTKLKETFSIGGLGIQISTTENGEIAVLNKSEFYVCPTCGFSVSEHEANDFSLFIKKEHKNTGGYTCKNTSMHKYSLGYRFKTDALHISINDNYEYDEAYSILQSIILSACNILNLDNNEISGCLQYTINKNGPSFDFIVYDTTPGGAGHVKRFTDITTIERVLKGAFNKAKNCDCGGEAGDSSCYKCLRSYQNKQHHDLIKRSYVISKLLPLFD